MRCPRCLNEDESYFFKGSKGYYCRKCIAFKRIDLLEELNPLDYEVNSENSDLLINYELTKYQKEASLKVREYIKDSDVFLYCVCGAGKTEIVLETISDYLKKGLKVCYAISRREVVKEMIIRFKNYFKKAKVVGLYGGHKDEISGDIIIATCHQLFRYYKTFDLLIIDEVDAFPLSNNETLMNIVINSSKSRIIFSSATINDFLIGYLKTRNYQTVKLLFRPSLKPLIEPQVYKGIYIINLIRLCRILKKQEKQMIVFVAKKKEAIFLNYLFKPLIKCNYVYSDFKNRDINIKDFKDKKYNIIFSTSLLERGINVQTDVIIFDNDMKFDHSAIIQMTGRVGRSIKDPCGNAYIFSRKMNKDILKAIKTIKEANHELSLL